MIPGGVTEIIYHFAGYLHITEELATDVVLLNGRLHALAQDDFVAALDETPFRPDEDDPFDTLTLRNPNLDTDDGSFPGLSRLPSSELDDIPPARKVGVAIPSKPIPPGSGGGGGSSDSLHAHSQITVVYEKGGEQILMQAAQINFMGDDDQVVINDAMVPALPHVNVDAKIEQLVDEAAEQVPCDLGLPGHTDAVPDFIAHHDAKWLDKDGASSPHSVTDGHYVNGELTPPPDGPNPLQIEPTVPADLSVPEELHHVRGDWAMPGGNTAINAALIVDLNEASPTTIVMGNFFKTDFIVQTNSYIDNDKVDVAGGFGPPQLSTHGDTANNIADFNHQPGVYPDLHGFFAGPSWHVDVVDGDYFDIRLLSQTNLLSDNDITVQDTQQSHYELHAGENGLYNLANIGGGDFKYDLIIILGDYHGANFIFQNNILLDQDIVKMLGLDANASQSLSTGDNALLNHAVIQTYGDDTFSPVTPRMEELLSALANKDSTLDPSFGTIVPGTGGPFNVLYVTGDYYDINAIWQNNVITDLDTAIQYFSPAAALIGSTPGADPSKDEPDTVQSIASGSNRLTNDAAIVDVGANDTHVQGGVYTDSILIQANLVTDDRDKIVHSDPQQLASELVAFVTPAPTEDQQDDTAIAPIKTASTSDDMLGGVMH
jgi:hypothetical protein